MKRYLLILLWGLLSLSYDSIANLPPTSNDENSADHDIFLLEQSISKETSENQNKNIFNSELSLNERKSQALNNEPYRNLIFSEVRIDESNHSYLELCNKGSIAIDLSEFELGCITPDDLPYKSQTGFSLRLPQFILFPDQTYVISTVYDWTLEQSEINPEFFEPRTKKDTWGLANLQIHPSESTGNDPTDSISNCWESLYTENGHNCFYLEHHLSTGDSVVVDAVNGIFTGSDGKRPMNGPSDVAGFIYATRETILIRKQNVTTGNLDWENAIGIDLSDSEWLPIPFLSGNYEPQRKEFWTVGNHAIAEINSKTLISNTIQIDFDQLIMKVPYGVRNFDSIMSQFQRIPGLAWHYDLSGETDNKLYCSVKTGDILTLYGCGNTIDEKKFSLIALAPTTTDNKAIPKNRINCDYLSLNHFAAYNITDGVNPMDTISWVPNSTRIDTFYKYLEKPDLATWEIIWVDGQNRTELKNGDILRIKSQNSIQKDYFIKTCNYRPNHEAHLASITWPDIPELYKGVYGWILDSLPKFSPTKYEYNLSIPSEYKGIPALSASPIDINAKITVVRAKSLNGTIEDRTIKFICTAEDGITQMTYSIILEKCKDFYATQPNFAEPFFSQIVFREFWSNTFIEICNPGNQYLDLSKYCIVRSGMDIKEAIKEASTKEDWSLRFRRYVPGYKWQDEANWMNEPSKLVLDLNVNPLTLIEPGGVFVLGNCPSDHWKASEVDVNFKTGCNPWGIELRDFELLTSGWINETYYLYKIVNDSVFEGKKPLNDPDDVVLIDIFGNTAYTDWWIGGRKVNQNEGFTRLPQYHEGNPVPSASFGTSAETSEWFNCTIQYWNNKGYTWPWDNYMMAEGVGLHEYIPDTNYKSTISSYNYLVSEGYSMNESIKGLTPGITVDQFFSKIIKQDENQSLLIDNLISDFGKSGNDILSNGDYLEVLSANGENRTRYYLEISNEGLDHNAVLVSDKLTISISGDQGKITGFRAGTPLIDIKNAVKIPETASNFTAFYFDGSYATFKRLNFDTTFVNTIAEEKIFFEVVAQDGSTKITYQLQPDMIDTDARVFSNVYLIDQEKLVIQAIPKNTKSTVLISNLIPAPGATLSLINKMGQKRESELMFQDDKILVTAQDGITQKVYFLSYNFSPDPQNLSMAYSNVYQIDQLEMTIENVDCKVSISDFLSQISIPPGSSVELKNNNGLNETDSIITNGDFLVVCSADQTSKSWYKIFSQGTCYFSPVWNSSEINHMNMNIVAARLDGNDLQAGDEIGVFDDSLCVGAGILAAPLSQTDMLSIDVSDDNGSGIGFVPGHKIKFKFYDRNSDSVISQVTTHYQNDNADWSSDGKFTYGATAFVELDAKTTTVPLTLWVFGDTLTSDINNCFNALQTITVAGNSSTVDFESGSIVDLIAGQSIQFLPGFHAQNGCQMLARITTDGSYCDGSSASPATPETKSTETPTTVVDSENQTNEQTLRIYPNPNNGRFTLELTGIRQARITICTLTGKILYKIEGMFPGLSQINLPPTPRGVYLVKVRDNKRQWIEKIIVHE